MECIYAALLLHRTGKEINDENIKKVLDSVGADVDEGKIKSLVASLKDVDIDSELANATVSAAPVASAEEAKPAAEEPKEEKSEEAAAEGLSSLFG